MPSILHEALVLLFRNEPALAAWLLERALGIPVPAYRSARLEDVTLNEVAPTEYRADGVVVLRNQRAKPVLDIVVEVQLGRRKKKRYTWPFYAAALRARLQCPTEILVVAPNRRIAAWARKPIQMGARSWFEPLVVGPTAVPRVTDVSEARRSPELAVLSVLAHASSPGAEDIARPALHAVDGLDLERSTLYADLILAALPSATRAALEDLMKTGYEYQSDFAKKYFGEGIEKGLERGIETGRGQGIRAIVLRQLRRLGLEPDAALAEQLAAASLSTLEGIADDLVSQSADPTAILDSVRRHLASNGS